MTKALSLYGLSKRLQPGDAMAFNNDGKTSAGAPLSFDHPDELIDSVNALARASTGGTYQDCDMSWLFFHTGQQPDSPRSLSHVESNPLTRHSSGALLGIDLP